MKTITNFQRNFLACGFAALLLGSASLAAAATTDDNVVRREGAISYVSGGVGSESLDRLSAIAKDFNLKLVFALTSGDYLSRVRVVIADSAGQTLLDSTAEGPWLLANLPAGNYHVAATLGADEQKREVAVAAGKLTTIDFRWAKR